MNQLMLFGGGMTAFMRFWLMRQGLPLLSQGLDKNIATVGAFSEHRRMRGISISPDGRKAVVFHQDVGYAAYGNVPDFNDREDAFAISTVAAAFALDDYYIVCGNAPSFFVKEWGGGGVRSYDTTGLGRVRGACLSPDNKRLFVHHSSAPNMRVYDLDTGNFTDAPANFNSYTGSTENEWTGAVCCTSSGEHLFYLHSHYYEYRYTGIYDTTTLEKTGDVSSLIPTRNWNRVQAIPHPHEADSIIVNRCNQSTAGALLQWSTAALPLLPML